MNATDPQSYSAMILEPPEYENQDVQPYLPTTRSIASHTTGKCTSFTKILTDNKRTGVILLFCSCLITATSITTTQYFSCGSTSMNISTQQTEFDNITTMHSIPLNDTIDDRCKIMQYTAYLGDDITMSLCRDQTSYIINLQKFSEGIPLQGLSIDISLAERLSYFLSHIIDNPP